MAAIANTDLPFDPAALWPGCRPTPLLTVPTLARLAQVRRVFVKLECARPLGNFKVLGGMVAGLQALARASGASSVPHLLSRNQPRRVLPRLLCASEGNHGLAVAAAAARVGGDASVYLGSGVHRDRAQRIAALGAQVVRIEGTYDDAVHAAAQAAARGEGLLIADTSADVGGIVVADVMAGYALLARELRAQFHAAGVWPSHLFVQAGVGGLAAALADGLRAVMHGPRHIAVVEPAGAACVAQALRTGHAVRVPGTLRTCAHMLACGLASAPALALLQVHAARSVIVDEHALRAAVALLHAASAHHTTASGAAGLAGLLHTAANNTRRAAHGLTTASDVLLVMTEGAGKDVACTDVAREIL